MKTQFGASSLMILTALGLAACSGQIGDDTSSGSINDPNKPNNPNNPTGGGPDTINPVTGEACRSTGSLASARISLVTDTEYVNIARDAFGVTFVPESTKPTDGIYPLDESGKAGTVMAAQGYI